MSIPLHPGHRDTERGGGSVDFLGWRDEMALEPEKGGGGKPDHTGTIVPDLCMEVEF